MLLSNSAALAAQPTRARLSEHTVLTNLHALHTHGHTPSVQACNTPYKHTLGNAREHTQRAQDLKTDRRRRQRGTGTGVPTHPMKRASNPLTTTLQPACRPRRQPPYRECAPYTNTQSLLAHTHTRVRVHAHTGHKLTQIWHKYDTYSHLIQFKLAAIIESKLEICSIHSCGPRGSRSCRLPNGLSGSL